MKTYNLKNEYNWRGDVAELLAKHMYKAKRTKGYDFRREPDLTTKENAFLKRFWKSIDLYKRDDSEQLEIYEVKAKTYGAKRKPDITTSSLEVYKQALAQNIKVHFVSVTFHDNWEVSFVIENFDEGRFRVNDGGWYRRYQKLSA
jgi:hypothetical protein